MNFYGFEDGSEEIHEVDEIEFATLENSPGSDDMLRELCRSVGHSSGSSSTLVRELEIFEYRLASQGHRKRDSLLFWSDADTLQTPLPTRVSHLIACVAGSSVSSEEAFSKAGNISTANANLLLI
ncbi:hypothetical protein FOL47_006276 [Perkinsus chesapeaki]|uniref:HAT C-terminal dimerisation domain-containing protein n=1 Tax=Perkinsus chesapeaki TaxID=330153 RepID=A0A7J6LSR0_PERCH|nr:hypothetical protein FOL47_006276 [Perkinsus chesapeaki]